MYLQKVLQSAQCLDEAAIAMNVLIRRLFCDTFDIPILKDLFAQKVEMKLKEFAVGYSHSSVHHIQWSLLIQVSIFENLRVVSIDLGATFPTILKVEPMQWNTQGIWFNLFVYYHGHSKWVPRPTRLTSSVHRLSLFTTNLDYL